MINISVNAEPLVGSEPLGVCHDMINLARKLGCLVTADLNGIPIVAHAIDSPESLVKEWRGKMLVKRCGSNG